MTTNDQELVKAGMDVASISAVLGWLAGVLPAVATVLTIVWMGIRIWETDTVRGWTGREKGPPGSEG